MESVAAFFAHPATHAFGLAFLGNVCLEAMRAVRQMERGRPAPARYRRKLFWAARFVLALGAGALAAATSAHNLLMAFYLGVSFPVVLESIVARQPPTLGGEE
jgi:hypothetical protein